MKLAHKTQRHTHTASESGRNAGYVKVATHYVLPGAIFMLLTAILCLNLQHGTNCSSGESHTETSLHRMALQQRLLALEEQAMENSLLLENFIRKLDARYKILSGDTVSTFRHQAHAEANQIALHLIEEPTPPMPRFLAAALEGEPGSLGAQIDVALANVEEFSEPLGSASIRRRHRSSSSSSAAGMEEHQVVSSGVAAAAGSASEELDEGEMYEKCRNLRDAYKVVVGSTWGNLPEYLQPAWRAYDCDYYGRLSANPVSNQAMTGNQAIA